MCVLRMKKLHARADAITRTVRQLSMRGLPVVATTGFWGGDGQCCYLSATSIQHARADRALDLA